METVRQTDDLDWSDRQLSGLGTSWNSLNTDDVTSSQSLVKSIKLTLVVGSGSHDLDFGSIALKINEDQLGSLTSDRLDSSSDSNSDILLELGVLSQSLIEVGSELIDTVSSGELVWVWVDSTIS